MMVRVHRIRGCSPAYGGTGWNEKPPRLQQELAAALGPGERIVNVTLADGDWIVITQDIGNVIWRTP